MENSVRVIPFKQKRATVSGASSIVCIALCAACVAVSLFTFAVLFAGV